MALTRFRFEADGVLIEGEGVVQITGAPVGEPPDPSEMIVGFLDALDAELVDQVALGRQGWGSGTLTAEIIGVLRDIALGKPLS
jgi:hypothetical protein